MGRKRKPPIDMYTPKIYLDDTLIVTNIEDRSVRQAAFEQLLEKLYKAIVDDYDHYRYRLDDLGYQRTSKVAEDCILPLLADVVKRFVAAAKGQRLTHLKLRPTLKPTPEPTPYGIACYSISLNTIGFSESDDSLIPVEPEIPPTPGVVRPPFKPIPYSDKVVLPPVEPPPERHVPKKKTRGVPRVAEVPPAIAPAAVDLTVPLVYTLPKLEYNALHRIMSPRERGQISFQDLRRLLTYKEIGFACDDTAAGSRCSFFKLGDSGLESLVIHRPHGGKKLNPDDLRKTFKKELGWSLANFVRRV